MLKPDFWLEQIPLGGVFLLTAATVLVSIWFGTILGLRRRNQPNHEEETSVGTVTSATLGLLAFMLAFTFGMAADRFQARKQLLLDEVNTIGTTWLRAGLLVEPHRSQIRKLLSDYVDLRVDLANKINHKQLQKLVEIAERSETLQDQMWSQATAMAAVERNSEIDALFIDSLNELIDLHNSRITVLSYHIPSTIWYVLYFITIFSMGTVGYQVGLSGKRIIKVSIVLAMIFSSVVFLIADLDRAAEGRLRVNQQPMFELQKKIQTSQRVSPQDKTAASTENIVTSAER